MSEGFTPGPWDSADHTVWAVDDSKTVNRFSALMQGGFVCRAQGWSTADRTTDSELRANARLIAAAPDLYAVLMAMVAESNEDGYPAGSTVMHAQSILCKARGEA